MKRITSICSASALLAAFLVTADVSAQIEFEGDENGLRVNGKTIDPSNLPEGLVDMLAEKEFALHWGAPFPMKVTVNGVLYEIWEDRIVETGETFVKADFNIVVNHRSIKIGGPEPDMPDRPDRPDGSNMGRMLVRVGDYADKPSLDSVWQIIRAASRLSRERAQLSQSQAEAVANRVVSVAGPEMISPLELSNYMSYIQGASDELSELIQYEWREEFEARQMAAEINNMSPGRERDVAIAELREKLTTIFHLKQDNRTREIRRMRLDLEKMQLQVEERNRNMERLIDMRLDELLGLGW